MASCSAQEDIIAGCVPSGVSGHAQRRRSTEARTNTTRQAPSRERSGTRGLLEGGRPVASDANQRLPATEH